MSVPVQVDAVAPGPPASYNAYFPGAVDARPGDAVVFTSEFTGQPHTVTLGTAVDQALAAAADALRRDATTEPPALSRLTRLLPRAPSDVNQAALQPCFVERGQPPEPGPRSCPARSQPAFDGRQAFYSSGFLPDGATFRMRLADDITPGAYGFVCLLQRDMVGVLNVVGPGTPLRPAFSRRAADRRQTGLARLLDEAVQTAGTAEPGRAAAGVAPEQSLNAVANVFAPSEAVVPAGGSLTWSVLGSHAIAFNAPAAGGSPLLKGPDGSWTPNPLVIQPAGGPGAPAGFDAGPSLIAAIEEQAPVVIDAGSWDGSRFRSSGLLRSSPRARLEYRLTFEKPGTYRYRCLVHPHMTGTVRVT